MAKFGRNGQGPVRPEKPGALERLDALEALVEGTLRANRQTFAIVESRLQNLEEMVEALTNVVGRPAVEEEAKRLHIERVEAKALKEKIAFEGIVKTGKVAPSEVVADLSIIVGTEKNEAGEQLYPSRVQLLFASLKPEYQEKLRGAKVGDAVETPFKSKLTVTEIYDIVQKPATPPPPPQTTVDAGGDPLPPVKPLGPEEEQKLAEELAAQAEETAAASTAVEEALLEDLAAISETAPQSS